MLARSATDRAMRAGPTPDGVRLLKRAWFLRSLSSWLRGGDWSTAPSFEEFNRRLSDSSRSGGAGVGGSGSGLPPRTDHQPPVSPPASRDSDFLPADRRPRTTSGQDDRMSRSELSAGFSSMRSAP